MGVGLALQFRVLADEQHGGCRAVQPILPRGAGGGVEQGVQVVQQHQVGVRQGGTRQQQAANFGVREVGTALGQAHVQPARALQQALQTKCTSHCEDAFVIGPLPAVLRERAAQAAAQQGRTGMDPAHPQARRGCGSEQHLPRACGIQTGQGAQQAALARARRPAEHRASVPRQHPALGLRRGALPQQQGLRVRVGLLGLLARNHGLRGAGQQGQQARARTLPGGVALPGAGQVAQRWHQQAHGRQRGGGVGGRGADIKRRTEHPGHRQAAHQVGRGAQGGGAALVAQCGAAQLLALPRQCAGLAAQAAGQSQSLDVGQALAQVSVQPALGAPQPRLSLRQALRQHSHEHQAQQQREQHAHHQQRRDPLRQQEADHRQRDGSRQQMRLTAADPGAYRPHVAGQALLQVAAAQPGQCFVGQPGDVRQQALAQGQHIALAQRFGAQALGPARQRNARAGTDNQRQRLPGQCGARVQRDEGTAHAQGQQTGQQRLHQGQRGDGHPGAAAPVGQQWRQRHRRRQAGLQHATLSPVIWCSRLAACAGSRSASRASTGRPVAA